jgi:hypothetical protein
MSHFSGYGAYMLFLALRTHFSNAKYDFFQFKGKLRVSKESYNKRHDKHFFEKIAKLYNAEELRDFYVSNLLKDKHYIMELLEDEAGNNYNEYKARRQALTYNFDNELERLFKHGLTSPFVINDSEYPYIISLYLGNRISSETLVILNDYIHYSDKFDKYLGSNDPIWSKVSLKVRKYKPFLKYDNNKFKNILKEKIDESTKKEVV